MLVLDALPAPGSCAVLQRVRLLIRYAQCCKVLTQQPGRTDADVRHLPRHQVIREIGQWVTQCRQFPIQYRDNSRLSRMNNHIVEAKITVDDCS